MSTVIYVMAWEFWSLSRVRMVATWIGLGSMNALFYHLVSASFDSLPPAAQLNLFAAIFFSDVLLIVFMLILARDFDHGKALDTRAFLLPLPTWQLVLSKMFFPVAAAGALWLAVSAVTRAVTSTAITGEWPLLAPALVAAMFTAWGLALFWFPLRPKPLKLVVAMALMAGPMAWTAFRFSEAPPDQAIHMWTSPTPAELATLAFFLLAAYATAVLGAVQARRGTTFGLSNVGFSSGWLSAFSNSWARGGSSADRFRSAASAQTWFEWRQKGWVVPSIVALALLVLGFMADDKSVVMVLWKLLGFFIVLLPAMIGSVMGRFSQSSQETSIDVFRASRPLSDRHLAHAILKAAGLSLLATWAVALTSVVTILGAHELRGGVQLQHSWTLIQHLAESVGWADAVLGLTALLVINWANMALVVSVFLTGRNRLIAAFVFIPYALGAAAFAGFKLLSPEAIVGVFSAAAWILSASALGGTVLAFVLARRRHLIGHRLPGLALASWLALVLVLAWRASDQLKLALNSASALEQALVVLAPGLLALAVAPLALAPLAVAWNRHR